MQAKIKIHPSASGYDLAASGYDKKEKYLDSFEAGGLLPLLGDVKGGKILDVGAGTGRLALRLARAGAAVTALDISAAMLGVLKSKNAGIETVVGDAANLPFPDETFDWVVAVFLIVHLKDPGKFFEEAYRVLKSGGRLLVTNINQKEPPAVATKAGPIKIESYYHRPEKIREMLSGLAFTIDKEKIVKEQGVWINQIIIAKK